MDYRSDILVDEPVWGWRNNLDAFTGLLQHVDVLQIRYIVDRPSIKMV